MDLNENQSDLIVKEKKSNFKERIWFVQYWVNYIKKSSDKEWSEQQARLINSQFKR